MRQIEIAWDSIGAKVRIELDEGHNADLVEPLWAALPYQTLQTHAIVAGDCVYHVVPSHELLHAEPDHRVERNEQPDGTVFCSAVQHLTIKYGELTEPMKTSPVGHVVPDDLVLLPKIGAMVWDATHGSGAPIIAQVRRVDGPTGHRVARMATDTERAAELVERISVETERMLIDPTDELIDAHEGRFQQGAGTKKSVLTTLVCINGETRPLGYMSYTGLVRAAKLSQLPLPALVEMARILLVKPTEFLGYCGLNTLWNTTQDVVAALETDITRTDYVALMSHMATYINAIGGWNLQLFPWELGGQEWTFRPTLTRSAHV
jgi:hypothetical protein